MKTARKAITILAVLLFFAFFAGGAFAAEITTYTVYFETNGGSYIAPYEGIHYNTPISEPPAPTRQGAEFAGWYMEPNLTDRWNFSLHHVTKDLTLYAKWSNLHRIFMEEGSASATYARQGERVNIRADSSGWFYTFDRWASSPSVAFGNRYYRNTYFVMPDRSVTIRAIYRYTGGGGDGIVVGGGCESGTSGAALAAGLIAMCLTYMKPKK